MTNIDIRPWPELQRLLPPLSAGERAALTASIEANGVQIPILVLSDGRIVDGHHRWELSQGQAPFDTCELSQEEAFLLGIELNLFRRHLNESQRAVIAAKLETLTHGGSRKGTDQDANLHLDRAAVASLFNVSPRTIATVKAVGRDAPDLLPKMASGELTANAARRKVKERKREAKREQNRELIESAPPIVADPGARYQTIVLDPPWDWGDEGDCDQFGRARPTYQTMPFEQILNLPIRKLATDNAHIYLWITNRSLPKGFALLKQWGFRYITALTWCKPHFGMGNYFRGSTEHILFGVRGSLSLLVQDQGTWFEAPRAAKHSSKPIAFYELVERCSPGPWLELFSREERSGWASWGAEV